MTSPVPKPISRQRGAERPKTGIEVEAESATSKP